MRLLACEHEKQAKVTIVSLRLVICATLSFASVMLGEKAFCKETANRSDEATPLAGVKNQARHQAQKNKVAQEDQTAINHAMQMNQVTQKDPIAQINQVTEKNQIAQMSETQKIQPSAQNDQAQAI